MVQFKQVLESLALVIHHTQVKDTESLTILNIGVSIATQKLLDLFFWVIKGIKMNKDIMKRELRLKIADISSRSRDIAIAIADIFYLID